MTSIILAEPVLISFVSILLILAVVLTIVIGAPLLLILYFVKRRRNPPPASAPPKFPPATEHLQRKCPQCGSALKADVPEGLCPTCLLQHGIATEGGAPPNQPPFVPPTIAELAKLFPQLEIIAPIGKGGMGAVYKARQPALDRFVALKILAPRPGNELDFASRFSREARALARLSHPNIVAVYDFGVVSSVSPDLAAQSDHRPDATSLSYFIMEYVDGPNLRQVQQAGRLAPREALEIIPQICAALQFAHDEGIVHRDIKPENVLLDKKGRVKIADFGLAKILGQEAKDFRLTGAKDVMGTPHYMAPEQVEKPQEVDHRADIFSLGVVFYEMLTGELPLGKFAPPSQKVQVDVRLDEVVLRALEKEPEKRYQQASQLQSQVETISSTPNPGNLPGRKVDSPSQPDRFWRRFAIVIASVILIPVVIAVLGLLAAIAIPAFVKGRQHAQAVHEQIARTGADSVRRDALIRSDYIGKSYFPKGDSIEIISVDRSPDRMTVRGRFHLVSITNAQLALYLTSRTTNDAGTAVDPAQQMEISKGDGDFTLVHRNLYPGLPHVSMYAGGKPFATIYFGTQAEAREESKLDLEPPNEPQASAETWGPSLAPDEKPDVQRIRDEAKSLMAEGRYEEALQRHLWCFHHARELGESDAVRLSFGLADWSELGRRFPKAKQAMIEIRDRDLKEFAQGRGYSELFQEIQNLNRELQQEDATYALFKDIQQRDHALAGQCYFYVENLLVEKGEYELCSRYLGDPQRRFDSISRMFAMETDSQKRMADFRRRLQEMNEKSGRTNLYSPPDASEMMLKSARDRLVNSTRQLIEILVATDRVGDAEKIRAAALVIYPSERINSAVADAERKLGKTRPQTATPPIPPTNGLQFRWVARNSETNLPFDELPDPNDRSGTRKLCLLRSVVLDDTAVASASWSNRTPNQKEITVALTGAGRMRFAEVTSANVGRPLAIVWNGRVLTAPMIASPITGGSLVITGSFTDAEADAIVGGLNHGKRIPDSTVQAHPLFSTAEAMEREFAARFSAAQEILSFSEKDSVMATIARDAAAAGNTAMTKKALSQITAFTTRDEATRQAARRLARKGNRAEALEITRTITSFTIRDETLRELAGEINRSE